MKNFILIIGILFLLIFKVEGQAIELSKNLVVANSMMGQVTFTGAIAPKIAYDGTDIITFGSIDGTLTLGTPPVSSSHVKDSYLAKHDKAGNLIWKKILTGANSALKVITDSNNNIIVAGFFKDSLLIDNQVFLGNSNQTVIFIAKFNSTGQLIWAKKADTFTSYWEADLTADATGNVYLTSSYTTTFSIENSTVTTTGNDDIFLAKFTPSGNLDWLINIGNIQNDRNPAIIGGINNDVYLTFSRSNALNTNLPNGLLLLKINSLGVQQWSKFLLRRYINFEAYLTRDITGSIYLTGGMDTTMTFDNFSIPYQHSSLNKTFLAKISPSGVWDWAKAVQTGFYTDRLNFSQRISANIKFYATETIWNQGPSSYNVRFYSVDNSGGILNYLSLTGLPYYNATNVFEVDNFTEDESENIYLSGGLAGTVTVGSQILTGPPALINPISTGSTSSVSYMAKILRNANIVNGTLFIDINGNGVKDLTESPFENGIVTSISGDRYISSDINGFYKMYFNSGSYALKVVQPANHYTFLPQTHTVSFTGLGQTQTKDFALVPIPNRNDVKVSVTNTTPARPGFALTYRLTFENVGTTTLSDTLSLTYDSGHLTYNSSSAIPATQTPGKLNWFYVGLQPTQTRSIDISFTVSTSTSVNTALKAIAQIKPISTDFIPANN